MKRVIRISLIVLVSSFSCSLSEGMTEAEYIQKYKADAIEQMLVYNIPASITLAQGILESGCGSSPLALYAKNHFGIKCHDDWNGPYFIYDDDSCGEHFRKYASVDDSYKDHARFIKSRPWYSFLFDYSRTDYYDWAEGLSRAGYATAPDYAEQLIYIIEKNHLYDCDTVLQNLQGFGILYGINRDSTKKLADYIIVKPGDCIYKIVREYKVDIAVLCRNNGLSIGDVLIPGEKLYLKEKVSSGNDQPADSKHQASNTKEDLSALPADTECPQG